MTGIQERICRVSKLVREYTQIFKTKFYKNKESIFMKNLIVVQIVKANIITLRTVSTTASNFKLFI